MFSNVPGELDDWLIAVRPHTLPASVSPVLVGLALAVHHGVFQGLGAIAALSVALLLQVAVNLANDYFDYQSGVDTPESKGFERACASGRLNPETVKGAMIIALVLSIVPGSYLVYQGGIPLLLAGVLSVLACLGYSGGPFPYASYALGDLMVFLFFGVVATTGTFYAQFCETLSTTFPTTPPPNSLPPVSWIVAVPPGTLSTSILVLNNLRDRNEDQEAGKYTLAVLLGPTGSILEIVVLFSLAYLVPLGLWITSYGAAVLLPLATLPWTILTLRSIVRTSKPSSLNQFLSKTGRLLFIHSLLFSAGLVLS